MKDAKLGVFLTEAVTALAYCNAISSRSQGLELVRIITGDNEPNVEQQLANNYEQLLGYVMMTLHTPDELMTMIEPNLRKIFDMNKINSPRLQGMTDEQLEVTFSTNRDGVRKQLYAIQAQMQEKWYDESTPAKRCSEGFTQHERSFDPINNAIPADTQLEVEMDDGSIRQGAASDFCWASHHDHATVIGFRLLEATH